jgi:hypothetical protein
MLCAGELGRLFFGRDDAELDITKGGLLRAGFLRTSRSFRDFLIDYTVFAGVGGFLGLSGCMT